MPSVFEDGCHGGGWMRAALAAAALTTLTSCGGLPVDLRQPAGPFPSPVAFVTPAPVPVPTALPTLPPIALPTQPPATAVPKRLPIDSTAAIGLWSDRLDPTRPYTGFLDLATGPAAIEMKAGNVALVALNRRQAHVGLASTVTETRASRPTWLLYDRDGRVAVSTDAREPLLNVREPAVQKLIADDVTQLARGYDGVVVDGIGTDLIRASASPVFSGTRAFTDQQRRDTAEALLRSLRGAAPDKLLIVGGYAWEDGTAFAARPVEAQDLAAIADGVHIGAFLRAPISGTRDFKGEAAWKRDIDFLSSISANDQVVLVSTRLGRADVSADLAEQWLNYAVASFLLGKNGARTYFQLDVGGPVSSADTPVLNVPIGAPEGSYTKLASGIFQRKFANGIALVNPGERSQSADLDTEYATLSGARVKRVTLSPDTGIVLVKP